MKKSFTINSVSKSADGKRAQVTVPFGTGRNRRSVTRHIRLVGEKWVGFNPDERAIPLNEKYEGELAEAQSELTSAEAKLKFLQGKLAKANEAEPEGFIENVAVAIVKAEFENAIELAKSDVRRKTAIVDDAETKLAIVQREVPLEVEFFGPGLTYQAE